MNALESSECRSCGIALTASEAEVVNPLEHGAWADHDRMTLHILVCPPLAPFRLSPDRAVIVGRGEDAQITLPGELVSRQHAEITCSDGVYYIEDLVSSNGTMKNGEKVVEKTPLADGDTLSMGGFQLRYQIRSGHEISNREMIEELQSQPTVVMDSGDIGILKMVRFVNANELSGVMGIEGEGIEGGIHFDSGEVVDSWLASGDVQQEGIDAFVELAALEHGRFSFEQCPWQGERRIDERMETLLERVVPGSQAF